VYREIAPRLVAEDSEFRREYEEMREQVHIIGARISGAAHADRIHRKWLICDFASGGGMALRSLSV
jgi:hypothetical protein